MRETWFSISLASTTSEESVWSLEAVSQPLYASVSRHNFREKVAKIVQKWIKKEKCKNLSRKIAKPSIHVAVGCINYAKNGKASELAKSKYWKEYLAEKISTK